MATKKLQIIGSLGSNVEVDSTLTQTGKAADAKAVGDAISNLNTLVGDTSVSDQITEALEGSAVLYNVEQSLTEEQKLQARNNIGIGETIVDTLFTLDLIEPLMEDDGEVLVDSEGTLLVTRNDDIFLPEVTEDNNGNVLVVENGKWTAGTIDIPEINYPVTSVNGQTGDVVIEIPTIPDAVINPVTASIGQTIVVKSIDENSKPTEWEAVDLPSAVTDEHINALIDAKLADFALPSAEEVAF